MALGDDHAAEVVVDRIELEAKRLTPAVAHELDGHRGARLRLEEARRQEARRGWLLQPRRRSWRLNVGVRQILEGCGCSRRFRFAAERGDASDGGRDGRLDGC